MQRVARLQQMLCFFLFAFGLALKMAEDLKKGVVDLACNLSPLPPSVKHADATNAFHGTQSQRHCLHSSDILMFRHCCKIEVAWKVFQWF